MSKKPLVFSEIEELRRKGYTQTQIAEIHGVSREAVSWHKKTYGGYLTPRQIVDKSWPWKTSNLHSKCKPFQRLRDHGEYMATGGRGMTEAKLGPLRNWYQKLRDENVVLEFDPDIPPIEGVSPNGGFRYVSRRDSDGDLLIRVNKHTALTEEGRRIWRFPPREP